MTINRLERCFFRKHPRMKGRRALLKSEPLELSMYAVDEKSILYYIMPPLLSHRLYTAMYIMSVRDVKPYRSELHRK